MTKKSTKKTKGQVNEIKSYKKILFFIIMICLPFFILIVSELILRSINYGGDYNLILTRKINETTYCYINKKVAKRFFSQQEIHIPDARTAIFRKEKSADTYRIFCLGGSTTAGFPYEFNATFPSLLKDRLDILFPEKNIEIINVGISAINSYSVLDFTKELIHYDPDLFLIYMGHNEFYGALGVGSTQQIASNRNIVLLYLKLQKSRLFNLLQDLIFKIRYVFDKKLSSHVKDHTLMEQVVRDRYINFESEKYKIARNYFSRNLSQIVDIAQKSGTKVLMSTLISNLAGLEPFNWQFASKTTTIQKEQWKSYLESGYLLEKSGKVKNALTLYNKANDIDDSPALLHYRQAKCLQKIGEIDSARLKYIRAKDNDALRFRASSDFNNVIREIGSRFNIPVIEMENVFAPFCKDEILDQQLFTDHLHPNFKGYSLMAKAFCENICNNDLIEHFKQTQGEAEKMTQEFHKIAGVTELDIEIANYRIKKLTSFFPFKQKIILRKNSGSEYDNLLEKTVREMFDKKIGWNEAHYRIAHYFERKGLYEKAEREYDAVIKVTPNNYFPRLELANLYLREKKYQLAETTLQTTLALSKNLPYAYAKLGMLYVFTNRPNLAVTNLEKAIAINSQIKKFKENELAGAFYLLSVAYAKNGKIQMAEKAANNALKINPEYKEAKVILKELNSI